MVVVLTPRGGRTGRRTFSRTVPVAERHTAGRHHLGTDLQSIIGWLQAHGSLLKILVQLRQHQGMHRRILLEQVRDTRQKRAFSV